MGNRLREYVFEIGDRVVLPSGVEGRIAGRGRGDEVHVTTAEGIEVDIRDRHLRVPMPRSTPRACLVPSEPSAAPRVPTNRSRVPSTARPASVPSSPVRGPDSEPFTTTELELLEHMGYIGTGPIEGAGYRPTGSHPWRRGVDKSKKKRGKPSGKAGQSNGAAR